MVVTMVLFQTTAAVLNLSLAPRRYTHYWVDMSENDQSAAGFRAARDEAASKAANPEERATALYEAHRDAIYRFLVRQGLSPAAAQDVTQDVFVDLLVYLAKGTPVNSEGWLYAVAGRAAVDYWRRERRTPWLELDSSAGAATDLSTSESSPEARAGREQRLRQVAAGVRRLPKELRLCIDLRMKGLRYREIAKILGVSTSTAAEWLASAVDRLRNGR